jgi:HKD family nuclease
MKIKSPLHRTVDRKFLFEDFQDQEAHYAILMTVYNKMQRTHSHKTTRKALFKCYSIDVSIAFYCMGGGE